MTVIGVTCPPIPGHLNPMLTLCSELERRGHRLVVMNVADAGAQVRQRGIEFVALGEHEHPAGSLSGWIARLQDDGSFAAIDFARQFLINVARVVLRHAPEVVRTLGIQGLIVDQMEYGGSTVAQLTGLPYVTVANALPTNRESGVPSVWSGWQPGRSVIKRARDRLAFAFHDMRFQAITDAVNEQRVRFSLPPYRNEEDYLSPLAQISQCPEAFDFPRRQLPATWYGVGPMRPSTETAPPFPFERLDGRPLVYASLGSLQGGNRALFATIAEACAPLGVQLVIAHGYKLRDEETHGFAGDPIVVPYAPQRALLSRARLVVTHAGMNTVLDSLAAGVPMVAIPLAFEQPAIAARILWHGVGEVVTRQQITVDGIRAAIGRVLSNARYRAAAKRIASEMVRCGGVTRAADVTERALCVSLAARDRHDVVYEDRRHPL